MTRPRKTTATSTGKIGKEKIKERQEQENKIKLDNKNLKAPAYLSETAKIEFARVVEEASKIDTLDNLDLSILAIYSSAYAQYLEITEEIQKMDQAYRYITEDNKISPLINAQDKIIKQIMTCSSKLGLATTDRLKLIVPTKEESSTNKYLRYIDG
ncbi:phage terminase small subunit P27 family [Peptoniphilus sp.]|uniref:phage terminase small subunit P27 family n=1 Tax=Peptoniphilus sp. TaxID=1971214 RepID=UPI0039944A1A